MFELGNYAMIILENVKLQLYLLNLDYTYDIHKNIHLHHLIRYHPHLILS